MEEGKERLQEFKSEHITLTVDHQPECVVRYVVEVDAELTKRARERAIHSLSKEVSLPGFRKGRAPRHLIVKCFVDLLDQRWQKHLADSAFEGCYELTHISPLRSPVSFHVKRHSIAEGAEMTFSFEREPEIPDIDISALTLREVKRDVVDEEACTVALNELRSFFGSWEKLSGREVQVGDYVLVDIDIIEQDPSKRALSNARFEVDKSKMAEWMFDLVIGMRIGESREGISQADRDAPKEKQAETPPKKVSLTLRGIEKLHLPDVDDALAKKVGSKDVEEMKRHLTMLLHKHADTKQHEEYRRQICAQLDTYSFDLPRSLVLEEKQARMRLQNSTPTLEEKLSEELDVDIQKSLRHFFISRKIVAKYHINIPNEHHGKSPTLLSQMFDGAPDSYKEQSEKDRAASMPTIMFQKATNYLISQASILPIEPTTQQTVQEEDGMGGVDAQGEPPTVVPSEMEGKSKKEPPSEKIEE